MDRCTNKKPLLAGIDSTIMVVLITITAVSLFALGSIQIPIACLLIFVIARCLYWYEPLFFLFLGSYLRMTGLYGSDRVIKGGKPFGDNLLWKKVVSTYRSGIILQNKDGSYQITFKSFGMDFSSSPWSEIQGSINTINDGLKVLSEYGITMYWEFRRSSCVPENGFLHSGIWELPYALKLMQSEKETLLKNTDLQENDSLLSIIFKPLPADRKVSWFVRLFVKSVQERQNYSSEDDIEKFKEILDKFFNVVSECLEPAALSKEQTAEYLHSCISTKAFESDGLESDESSNWANFLPDQALYKGLNPMLESRFIKAVGIKGFPASLNPEMRNEIGRLPGEFKWIIRADFFNQGRARKVVKDRKTAWANSSINMGAVIASLFTGGHEDTTQKFENDMANDCQEILDDLKEEKYRLSKVSSTFIITDESEDQAVERAEVIRKTLENHGINACVEDLNTMQAFLSSIPGSIHKNPRQFLFSSKNLTSHLLPLSSPWKGSSKEDCLFIAKGRD